MEVKTRIDAKNNIQKLLKSNKDFKARYNKNSRSTKDQKNISTEYNENYIEWPISAMSALSATHQNHSTGSPYPLYYGDENDSNINTVYKSTYSKHDGNYEHMKENTLNSPAAGVPYNRETEAPHNFAWAEPAIEYDENASPNVDSGMDRLTYNNNGHGNDLINHNHDTTNDISTTEYTSLYKWPSSEMASIPAKRHESNVMIGQVGDKVNVPSKWVSEYNGRFQSPSNKKQHEPSASELIDQIKKMNQVLSTIKNTENSEYGSNTPSNNYSTKPYLSKQNYNKPNPTNYSENSTNDTNLTMDHYDDDYSNVSSHKMSENDGSFQSNNNYNNNYNNNNNKEPTTSELINQIKNMNQVLSTIKNTENSEYGSNTPLNNYSTKPYMSKQNYNKPSTMTDDSKDSTGSFEPVVNTDPVAGIRSARRDTIPNFYAWPIEYVDFAKGVANNLENPFVTEYDRNFHDFELKDVVKSVHDLEVQIMEKNRHDTVTELTHTDPGLWVTEYDDKFKRNKIKKHKPKPTTATMTSNGTNANKLSYDKYDDNHHTDDNEIQFAETVPKYQQPLYSQSDLPTLHYDDDSNGGGYTPASTTAESETLKTEYVDRFQSPSTQFIESVMPAGVSTQKKNGNNNEYTPRTKKNSGKSKITDTLGTAAIIASEKAVSRGNSIDTSEDPSLCRTIKKRKPKSYERIQVRPTTTNDIQYTGPSLYNEYGEERQLSETQRQYRWPSTNTSTPSDSRVHSFVDDTIFKPLASRMTKTIKQGKHNLQSPPKSKTFSPGTLAIGLKKNKIPKVTVHGSDSPNLSTPTKQHSYRSVEYKDNATAAVRVLTPVSQDSVRSYPTKKASDLNRRRSSASATGLYQKLSPHKVHSKLTSRDDIYASSAYDPILVNKRYPQESEKQIGRWTTESRGSFNLKLKKATGPILVQ